MKKYSVRIPPAVASFVRHLHPNIKRRIRAALKELESDPHLGKPLKEDLQDLWSYRVSYYRIVYRIKREQITIEIIEIAERNIVYQRVLEYLKRER